MTSADGSRVRRLLRRLDKRVDESGIDWLIYNPYKMYEFHCFARKDASPVMDTLAQAFPDARCYADVGAGSGAFAAEAARRGRRVVACERSRWGRLMARQQGVDCRSFELTDEPPADLPGPFDLAYCFEVAEHVPEQLADRLVGFLAGLSDTIVFTAAPPGQGGTGHVNEQPMSYWIEKFARHGIRHDGERTQAMQAAFERSGVWAPWLISNVNVFERARADTVSAAT
jgi:SAM-dependent methyltransferase